MLKACCAPTTEQQSSHGADVTQRILLDRRRPKKDGKQMGRNVKNRTGSVYTVRPVDWLGRVKRDGKESEDEGCKIET